MIILARGLVSISTAILLVVPTHMSFALRGQLCLTGEGKNTSALDRANDFVGANCVTTTTPFNFFPYHTYSHP